MEINSVMRTIDSQPFGVLTDTCAIIFTSNTFVLILLHPFQEKHHERIQIKISTSLNSTDAEGINQSHEKTRDDGRELDSTDRNGSGNW